MIAGPNCKMVNKTTYFLVDSVHKQTEASFFTQDFPTYNKNNCYLQLPCYHETNIKDTKNNLSNPSIRVDYYK